ncbi:DUF6090 family protein [Rhodohalobacter mucosus]|uniref:Uncharacterized protein n=1 Tax=Rhodohalobacter mucosus TaxID=2079485 RepID=A0A316TVV5_9BACT|nr:DUF6090 family protein [Rhodohalobacter mucosus]PWN07295.1 hypothetical protein DDZ15_03235 [Rhodohalobacter mucosus]
MEQKKVRTYMLYAVGEILLVVIGILIALQVNNWNEERLRLADEREVLQNVKTDFQDAIQELSYLNSLRKSMNEIIDDFVKDGPFPDERFSESELDSMFAILQYAPTFNNQSGSLDVLLNSGRINLVRDDSLRAMLLNWPGLVQDMVEGEISQVEFQTDSYIPKVLEYLSLNRIYKHFKMTLLGDVPMDRFDRKTRTEPDYSGLFRDPEFENILINREFFLQIALEETETVIQTANRIIARIDQHTGS